MTEADENYQIHATCSQDWLVAEQKTTRHWKIPPSTQDYNRGTVGECDKLVVGVPLNMKLGCSQAVLKYVMLYLLLRCKHPKQQGVSDGPSDFST
jgi:hypothetical protein